MKAERALKARDRDPERWRQAVVAALQRDAAATRIEHTLQITSFGGAGTNALIEHLTRARCDLPNTAGHYPFKHGQPPAGEEVPPGYRVIYVHADPRNTVISLFRRNLQTVLCRWLNMMPPGGKTAERLTSLDSFLAAAVDDFGFERHFDRWLDHKDRSYPVMFVRYERFAEAWDDVRRFVGLAPDFPSYEHAPRGSDWTTLPDWQRDALDSMYEAFAQRLAYLPAALLG